MDWINFIKLPPKIKGLNCVAISGVGLVNPYSASAGGVVVSSATAIWYYPITDAPKLN